MDISEATPESNRQRSQPCPCLPFYLLAWAGLALWGCSGGNATDAQLPITTNGARIQGGSVSYPVGALVFRGSSCTASLIAPDLALTANHCVSSTLPMRIYFQQLERSADVDPVDRLGKNCIAPPCGVSAQQPDQDVAVVHLSRDSSYRSTCP